MSCSHGSVCAFLFSDTTAESLHLRVLKLYRLHKQVAVKALSKFLAAL